MARFTVATGADITQATGAFDASQGLQGSSMRNASSNATIELRVVDGAVGDAQSHSQSLSSAETVSFQCVTGAVEEAPRAARVSAQPARQTQSCAQAARPQQSAAGSAPRSAQAAPSAPKQSRKPSDAEMALMSLGDDVVVAGDYVFSRKGSSAAARSESQAKSGRRAAAAPASAMNEDHDRKPKRNSARNRRSGAAARAGSKSSDSSQPVDAVASEVVTALDGNVPKRRPAASSNTERRAESTNARRSGTAKHGAKAHPAAKAGVAGAMTGAAAAAEGKSDTSAKSSGKSTRRRGEAAGSHVRKNEKSRASGKRIGKRAAAKDSVARDTAQAARMQAVGRNATDSRSRDEETSDAIEALKFAEELFAKDALEMDLEAGREAGTASKPGRSSEQAAARYLQSKGEAGGKHSKRDKNDKRGKRARRGNDDFEMFITVRNDEDDERAEDGNADAEEQPDVSREEGSAAAARYTNRKKKSRRQKRKEERERQAAIEANKKPLFEPMDSARSRSGRKARGKANKSQHGGVRMLSGAAAAACDSAAKRAARSDKFKVAAVVAAVVLMAGIMLYPTAREYYASVRGLERSNAQLAQLEDRNVQLQEGIDALATDDGIENYARSQYGWVKDGEEAVSVIGLADNSSASALEAAGNSSTAVKEEKSALTEFLDAFFGVK